MVADLIAQLPQVRGRYTADAPLGAKGWFRCGGTAEVLFKPKDQEDLIHFLQNCPTDVPIHVFGALSNTIIRDGGLKGVTIRLGREFSDIKIEGDLVTAGALALDANVAMQAAENGVGGLEFLSGIPGSIGGAIKMNAGCYGTEIKDILVEARAIDRTGVLHKLKPSCHSDAGRNLVEGDPDFHRNDGLLNMTYRHTNLADDMVVVSATFKGQPENADDVKQRISDIKEKREQSQPIREKTGGSTFTNPSVEDLAKAGFPEDTKVWQLVDKVGGRGLEVGGAQMSVKHCNFMLNSNEAVASDLEALGEEIKKRVLDECGITLIWEIRRIGEKGA